MLPSMTSNSPGRSSSSIARLNRAAATVVVAPRISATSNSLRMGSIAAFSAARSRPRSSHCLSTGSGGSRQSALLIVVPPPTHMPWSTWRLKSVASWSAPSL